MKDILIVGATSAIAQACAREWLAREKDCRFLLTGRDRTKLESLRNDLEVRGAASVSCIEFDLNDKQARQTLVSTALQSLNQLDRILVAPGSLPDQQRCQDDEEYAAESLETNANATMLLLEQLAKQLEKQRTGRIAVISSVAGDRGRMSNYYYGAAKAAVTTFCSGLMARLDKVGVSVSIVKPGFVRTPMTQGLDLPEKLVAKPEQVGRVIVNGTEKGIGVIYAPGFWLLIMTIIKLVPTPIFRKLSL